MEKILFTSESVTEGHPDKMCDAISDAILDALMEKDPMSRVACETATTTGLVLVMGEITTNAYVDIQKIVRDTIREIGYTRGKYGFDADTCAVITAIDEQSADIAAIIPTALLLLRQALDFTYREELLMNSFSDYVEHARTWVEEVPVPEKADEAVKEEIVEHIADSIRQTAAAGSHFSGMLTPEEDEIMREIIREFMK